MTTVTAAALAQSYKALYPSEVSDDQIHEHERILGNWLERCLADPSKAVATANWAGKVTSALFHALGEKQPRTKAAMLEVLSERLSPAEEPAAPSFR